MNFVKYFFKINVFHVPYDIKIKFLATLVLLTWAKAFLFFIAKAIYHPGAAAIHPGNRTCVCLPLLSVLGRKRMFLV